MPLEVDLILRLLFAALLGGAIGLEREWRAKEAGLRTHFLVALGSALFMVVSQFGFSSALDILLAKNALASQVLRSDVSRVAAQVVTGISFLGAGTIVLHKHFVVGLTTAAAVWTTAAIGMAAGGGMWIVASIATLLTLAGLELFLAIDKRIGKTRQERRIVFWTLDGERMDKVLCRLRSFAGVKLSSFSSIRHGSEGLRVSLSIETPPNAPSPGELFDCLREFEGVEIEAVE